MVERRENQSFLQKERRENHDECGDNRKRKYIKRTSSGEVWFCHNCGGKGFIPDGLRTPRETVSNILSSKQSREDVLEQVVRDIQLPYDATSDIPPLGLGWLYKYYITDEEIKQFGICYSESYNKLILPVYQDETLIYWQGRNLKPPYTKDNPKYINIRQSGAKNVFFKRYNGFPSKEISGLSKELVVVEDILSAIRVGRFCNSLALLGSYFPVTLLNLFREYENIIIYLDYDKRETAIKAAIKFNKLTGKRFVVKQHPLDPKVLNPKELEDFLED